MEERPDQSSLREINSSANRHIISSTRRSVLLLCHQVNLANTAQRRDVIGHLQHSPLQIEPADVSLLAARLLNRPAPACLCRSTASCEGTIHREHDNSLAWMRLRSCVASDRSCGDRHRPTATNGSMRFGLTKRQSPTDSACVGHRTALSGGGARSSAQTASNRDDWRAIENCLQRRGDYVWREGKRHRTCYGRPTTEVHRQEQVPSESRCRPPGRQ